MKNELIVELRPMDVTVLFANRAELYGGLELFGYGDVTQGEQGETGLWVENWISMDDYIAWKVEAPAEGDYYVTLSYSCVIDPGGSEYEIVAGDSKVAGTVHESKGWSHNWFSWTSFEREQLEGTLHLTEGVNRIEVRPTRKVGSGEVMRLYSLDLTPVAAGEAIAAAGKRAEKMRADTEWFAAARYGVMFHWETTTKPHRGLQKSFPDAVRDFDVNAFADMVEQTGAGYVIFTTVHGDHWWTAPIQTVDRLLPGHTCERDLINDMADALDARSIKLILYYCNGGSEEVWSQASGFDKDDKTEFNNNLCDLFTEIGRRYGKKVAGYWIDFNPYNVSHHFETMYKALKTGNPDRIVAWNSWIVRRPSDFQEYWAGEATDTLILPEHKYFSDLQPHILIILDDEWVHDVPDTDIRPPLFETHNLIDYVKAGNARNIVVSMNLGIYEDGTISPATLEQMQALRKEIRGK